MDFDAGPAFVPPSSTIDWARLKAEIVSRLEIPAEYAALGLRLAGHVNGSTGKVQAHAMGRQDDSPSAFISTQTGIYHAHGDPPETLGFFDFALRYGQFGEWLEVLRHYAEKAGVEVPRVKKTGKGWVEEAIYDYRNESGELLYQVIRYRQPNGKKTFRQRRPDGKGGWLYNLENTRRVLYRLPELVAADPSRMVLVVEGEKDVETLSEAGLLAVSAPQGAEAAGRRQWEDGAYTGSLAARSVVVIPDNDPPGHSLAQLIARTIQPVAASVRILHLEDLPAKGDVSDWLESGHETEELVRLAEAAPLFDPEAAEAEPDPNVDATAADLMAANAGTRWLWEGWIPLSVLTLLTAEPSTGKTRLCLDLTKRIANLTTWPDGKPIVLTEGVTNRVLWIAADHQHGELADLPGQFGFDPRCIVLNATVGDLYGGTELQTEEQLADLEARILRIRPALVVIDTVTNTADYKSQDTSEAKRQYKPLQGIAMRTGAAIVCVTHTNIAGKTLGRRADEKTRVTIRLEKPDPDQEHRRKLSVALSRLSVYPPALGVTMGDSGNEYDTEPPRDPNAPTVQNRQMPPPAVQEAIGFLTARLAQGAVRVSHVRTEAEHREPAISARALYRARDVLEIEEYEEEGRKWWRLTTHHPEVNGAPW